MKSFLQFLTILFTFSASAFAHADSCAEAYQKINDQYFERSRLMESNVTAGSLMGLGSLAGWGICMRVQHSLLGCTYFFGIIGAVGGGFAYEQSGELEKLESGMKIYQIYLGRSRGIVNDETLDLLADIDRGASADDPAAEIAKAMDAGELCPEGQPLKTYEELVNRFKKKKD